MNQEKSKIITSKTKEVPWGIKNLPKTLPYNPDDDIYIKFYDIENICKCGHQNWIMCYQDFFWKKENIPCAIKIQRCEKCEKIRLINLNKEKYEKLIALSNEKFDRFFFNNLSAIKI